MNQIKTHSFNNNKKNNPQITHITRRANSSVCKSGVTPPHSALKLVEYRQLVVLGELGNSVLGT